MQALFGRVFNEIQSFQRGKHHVDPGNLKSPIFPAGSLRKRQAILNVVQKNIIATRRSHCGDGRYEARPNSF